MMPVTRKQIIPSQEALLLLQDSLAGQHRLQQDNPSSLIFPKLESLDNNVYQAQATQLSIKALRLFDNHLKQTEGCHYDVMSEPTVMQHEVHLMGMQPSVEQLPCNIKQKQ